MAKYEIPRVDKESGEVKGVTNIEVKAYPIAEPKGRTKGFASVNIDDMWAIKGISVVEGNNGLFVQMPQTKIGKDYKDLAHPLTTEGRNVLNEAVLTEYSVAIEAMVAQKVSTLDQLRESAAAAKHKVAPASEKAADKAANVCGQVAETAKKVKKTSGPEH